MKSSLQGEAAIKSLKDQGWYDSLAKAMAEARYELRENRDQPGVWQGSNEAHGLRQEFTSDGVRVETKSTTGEPHRLGLRLRSIGYGVSEQITGTGNIEGKKNRIEIRRSIEGGELTEWYVNSGVGLEHGYTLSAPPGERRGEVRLRVVMAIEGDLRTKDGGSGQKIEFENESRESVLTYEKLAVEDVLGRRLAAKMGAEGNSIWIEVDDRDATYPVTIDPTITQQAYLKASNTGAFDLFGRSVAISGETVVVGAYQESRNATGVNGDQTNNSAIDSGAAYVFVRSGGTWSQQAYLKASNTGEFDQFGYSVAISGETIVVVAPGEDSNATGVNGDQTDNSAGFSGAAYVFVRSGGTWSQQAYLKASNTGTNDLFGWSVAISGETIVVGAIGEDSNATGVNGDQTNNSAIDSGAAYVFVRSGGTWSQLAYLKASNTGTNDLFGYSVAISGETIVVGAPNEADTGAAYIFSLTSPPFLTNSISDSFGCTGPGDALNVTLEVTNPSGTAQVGTATASLPAQLLALPGTCAATIGACTVVDASTISWSGTLAPGQRTTITYQVQVADGTASGAQLCIASTASFTGGSPATINTCATVNCPGSIPGLPLGGLAETNDQKPGSVLIFNIYTSSATAPATQNTRISITNTDVARSIAVHFFFVDGSNCSVADRYICLTQSQTMTLLTSEQDPGTTGYLVAVAVDSQTGCPINFNHLIGDEYVKFATGHAANLGAESIPAIAGGLPPCNANSDSAVLSFDGIRYGRVAAVLASSSIQSRGDGNDTLLIVNRINGDLRTTASTLGSLFGILYDNAEEPHSFTLAGQPCQLRSSLSNSFPRTTPRFEVVIPAGNTGWIKLYSPTAVGILGAQINFNANVGSAAGAFNQGHNLHKLRLSNTNSYTIPIFPPACL
jgi:hypothetical protein